MSNCALGNIPLEKGNKFSLHQCPKNELERKDMERFLYALTVGSLRYAQVCTHLNIAYIVGMLGKYLSNPGMDHWKKANGLCGIYKELKIICSHIEDPII